MDGNGRWARKRLRPRTFGHHAGQKAVRSTIEFCLRRGITALTLFAFSSENWQRPADEVSALMELFLKALDREVNELHGYGVRIRFIGELSAFAPALAARMNAAMDRTAANTRLELNIAVNYGGRWDITQAAARIARAVQAGEIAVDQIDERRLEPYLCLADQAPIDLFIRTGGEQRLSNFLLWQIAYAEIYFTATLWPDFDAAAFELALADFAGRERRFGKTSAQIAAEAG
ncbi:MAG: di-trans,poly-cis-decaprenylcistransferase [Rhodanobacteraceae bacterium]|nr:di-trans,poly-cis-decaprenylcistransferase [Rhodanobacteraceae bacterium]